MSSSPPSGITPASSFELAGFEPELPPPAILADKIDPHTGDFASLTAGYAIADGLALFLLSVERGTGAAVRGFGHRFREITHVDEQASHSYEAFVREALDPGIRSGTLRFERVSVTADEEDPTQLNPQVDYVDLLAAPKARDRNRTFLSMTAPTELEFHVFRRGEVREIILANFRTGLRAKVDPDTGVTFLETTIKRVTQEGSRFYVEADSDDLIVMANGKRAEFLAQQISHDRAGHAFLVDRHAVLWDEPFLPGFSATGQVLATGTPGATFVGSTDIPDPLATYGVDPKGNRFQVYIGGVADADGQVELTLASIDTGSETNITVGKVIRWTNPPIGSDPEATVIDNDFSGGQPPENDPDYIDRLGSRIRHKPAAGNDAQFRAWAREASVSVEDAFIYPCAFNAGSVLVVVTQKRGDTVGPSGRLPSAGVLTAVEDQIVPPASPVVPPHVHVLVVAPQTQSTDMVLLLSLLRGASSGWKDVEPFPTSRGALSAVAITLLTNQQDFRITAGSAGQLPAGVAGPLTGVHLMVWNDATSAFVDLDVNVVTDIGAGVYHVTLNSAPAGKVLALGDYISPSTQRKDALAAGVVEYFDSLGPGEVVDLTTDVRGSVAFRRPIPSEEFPARAGQSIITFVSEALGSALADAQLDVISVSTPTVPTDPLDGPELIVPGKLNVLPLT